jgi:hypothetical protein
MMKEINMKLEQAKLYSSIMVENNPQSAVDNAVKDVVYAEMDTKIARMREIISIKRELNINTQFEEWMTLDNEFRSLSKGI